MAMGEELSQDNDRVKWIDSYSPETVTLDMPNHLSRRLFQPETRIVQDFTEVPTRLWKSPFCIFCFLSLLSFGYYLRCVLSKRQDHKERD